MKTILRNLISVIRRFKIAAMLNLIGLGVALVAFMIIMMQVEYDNNFDKFHPDAENIFRVDLVSSSWSQARCQPTVCPEFYRIFPSHKGRSNHGFIEL